MTPEVAETIAGLRARLTPVRRAGARIGFVPTMGALHEGHASLMRHARRASDLVVVSIFVNPLQFDRPDDLVRYPRTLGRDLAVCESCGVDVVFAPGVAEMYPEETVCAVDPGRVADHLCGRFRPGHFRGVATVVLKLFQIVGPDVAYFGEKDAQQLAVVRRLVRDLNVPVVVEGVATVREPDGLALSSRNQRLDDEERTRAVVLYRALEAMRADVESGSTDVRDITKRGAFTIAATAGVRLEYLEIVEPEKFQPVRRVDGPVIAAGAMWVGDTRLIDNVRCVPRGAEVAGR
jgi:pantoate--beta-alanine ligase